MGQEKPLRATGLVYLSDLSWHFRNNTRGRAAGRVRIMFV